MAKSKFKAGHIYKLSIADEVRFMHLVNGEACLHLCYFNFKHECWEPKTHTYSELNRLNKLVNQDIMKVEKLSKDVFYNNIVELSLKYGS